MATVKLTDNTTKKAKALRSTAIKAVGQATRFANRRFIKHISLHCHSLADLAAMDHPYATRHGGFGYDFHDPWWEIHRQSGALKSTGVQKPEVVEMADSVIGWFGFQPGEVALALVGGTSRMIPRPVVWGTLGEVKKEVSKIIVDAFQGRYGSSMEVNIGAE